MESRIRSSKTFLVSDATPAKNNSAKASSHEAGKVKCCQDDPDRLSCQLFRYNSFLYFL